MELQLFFFPTNSNQHKLSSYLFKSVRAETPLYAEGSSDHLIQNQTES